MKENKKSHVTNIIRRTATLTRRDWDNHILSGQNGGMAGWRDGGMANGERKMPISRALLFCFLDIGYV